MRSAARVLPALLLASSTLPAQTRPVKRDTTPARVAAPAIPQKDTSLVRLVPPSTPQPATVQVLPKTDGEYRAERESKAEGKTDAVAIAALIFAALSLCVAAWQALLFVAQLKLMRKQSKQTEDQLVLSTAASKQAEDQLKLAQDEFRLVHRPRLVVRGVSQHIELSPEKLSNVVANGLQGMNPLEMATGRFYITFDVVNHGVGVAQILSCKVSNVPFLNVVNPEIDNSNLFYNELISDSEPCSLNGGELRRFVHKSDAFVSPGSGRQPASGLITGVIKYADVGKTTRRVGFIREVNGLTTTVKRVDDSDYEYSD